MQSQQQKVNAAMDRMESASTQLLLTAEKFASPSCALWELRDRRKELLRAARDYSQSVQRLTRVRRVSK